MKIIECEQDVAGFFRCLIENDDNKIIMLKFPHIPNIEEIERILINQE